MDLKKDKGLARMECNETIGGYTAGQKLNQVSRICIYIAKMGKYPHWVHNIPAWCWGPGNVIDSVFRLQNTF